MYKFSEIPRYIFATHVRAFQEPEKPATTVTDSCLRVVLSPFRSDRYRFDLLRRSGEELPSIFGGCVCLSRTDLLASSSVSRRTKFNRRCSRRTRNPPRNKFNLAANGNATAAGVCRLINSLRSLPRNSITPGVVDFNA